MAAKGTGVGEVVGTRGNRRRGPSKSDINNHAKEGGPSGSCLGREEWPVGGRFRFRGR